MGSHSVKVAEANFQADVLDSEMPVLVEFWAEWCSPCRMLNPLLDQIAVEYLGKLKLAKVDADANEDVLTRYNIMSMPTLVLFKDGEPVEVMVGYQPKDKILKKLVPHLA